MANEIIDLTTNPTPEECIILDNEQLVLPLHTQHTADGKNKRSRRKKRKRPLDTAGSQPSATHTREHSLEEGELDGHSLQAGEHFSGENVKRKKCATEEQEQISCRLSRSPRQPLSSPRSPVDPMDVFFIDDKPAPLPTDIFVPQDVSDGSGGTLLLPAHVSVFGLAPAEILPASGVDIGDEDYIEYLDYDEVKQDLVRYFEDPSGESAKKANRTVCKNCGAEGEHKTAACPVLICLTCGARNEHPTRSCPISKTCFTCGMKGHINAVCPNRNTARISDLNRYDNCSRCGSHLHNENECPTLWRLYQYLTDEEQKGILRTRDVRRTRSLGQGGEGHIAADKWCYNCGFCGHWGDDCQDIPHRADLSDEPSAFSTHNTLSGPFFDAELPRSTSYYREPREWELNPFNAWGSDLPENVGKQGRKMHAEKMGKRAQEQEADDDPQDWFGNPRYSRSRGPPQDNERGPPVGLPKKMSFGKSVQQAGRRFQSTSLADRLGEPSHRSDSRKSARPWINHEHDRKRHSKRDDRRREAGPRYKGGYVR